tara:strand:- start:767 stop:961 length:195 start_codon:yes stop_codon:yes gene_type:complete
MNTLQLQKQKISTIKTERLYRELQNCDNQTTAFSYILDFLHEDDKVNVRKYMRELIKEDKKERQ